MSKKKYVGKIGYATNAVLGIGGDPNKGHYIYIRDIENKGGKAVCEVNTFTSLERGKENYQAKKLAQVRKGNVYSIPYRDANFTEWTGVSHDVIKGVPLSAIQNIGQRKIKQRHRFFIGKFMKKDR